MPATILWVDDEIDLLRPYVIFLEQKGYNVETATNGHDAIEMVNAKPFDLVFLDENMPGISGLETLNQIKQIRPTLPVVMVTKSEEENIMDDAIGSKIADYLIKPVNPKQILLSIKKHIHGRELVTEKQIANYRVEFGTISQMISSARTANDWANIYRKLAYWQVLVTDNNDSNLKQILEMQQAEANHAFSKFIKNTYVNWFKNDEDKPLLSPNLLKEKVFPLIDNGRNVLVVLIDNLRYDQWKIIEPLILENWKVETEDMYYSILPTATQYARNAIFAGLMPMDLQNKYPELWVYDEEDEGKNLFEFDLLKYQLQRLGKNYSVFYEKANTLKPGMKIVDNLKGVLQNNLSVIVYNFVDMMSHSRTDSNMMRELASDEVAYLSLTRSWFQHSDLRTLLNEAAKHNVTVVITTDHGTMRVQNPVKVIGDKSTSTNLRYKLGRNLNYSHKDVFEIKTPADVHLPRTTISSSYIFAFGNNFFAYPNNYNYYVNYYRDTFQHGGISLEEMIIPVIVLSPNI
ncbi:MAG TPA: PglZ domain-containing protein [Tenuifilaceae bacterium]|nr:PglZ domain-containing protein [Tenuifilaceae bacterium]